VVLERTTGAQSSSRTNGIVTASQLDPNCIPMGATRSLLSISYTQVYSAAKVNECKKGIAAK
jgi:hypothetical protein